jgi:hypothetical protein
MAHFFCHLGAHILGTLCSVSILPKTVKEQFPLIKTVSPSAAGGYGLTGYFLYDRFAVKSRNGIFRVCAL